MHIAATGDVNLLNALEPQDAWEEIVAKNCKANGATEYQQYLELAKSYALNVNEYIRVKAALTKLSVVVDKDLAGWLSGKGYKIEMTNSSIYAESLSRADAKSNNLLTRINMKKNAMARLTAPDKQENKTLEEILASLSYAIGFPVSDDITLARFNEYTRILKLRADQEKMHHGRVK